MSASVLRGSAAREFNVPEQLSSITVTNIIHHSINARQSKKVFFEIYLEPYPVLIEWYGYIVVMPLINGPDEELNEILYQISVDFWEQVFNALLNKQKNCKQDLDISPQQAIITLQREIKNLAKTNHLICTTFPHNEHFYLSLLPYPIYIGIENNTGCSSVSAPNIKTIHFNHTQWRNTLLWIQNYIELDITPLEEKKKLVREKIYLNFKNVQIVLNSILCEVE